MNLTGFQTGSGLPKPGARGAVTKSLESDTSQDKDRSEWLADRDAKCLAVVCKSPLRHSNWCTCTERHRTTTDGIARDPATCVSEGGLESPLAPGAW